MKYILFFTLILSGLIANAANVKNTPEITSSSKVEMYTALFWAPCKEAKALLQSRGIEFETYNVTFSRTNAKAMKKRSGGRMDVPQIFVDDLYFGDLAALKSYFTTNTKTE